MHGLCKVTAQYAERTDEHSQKYPKSTCSVCQLGAALLHQDSYLSLEATNPERITAPVQDGSQARRGLVSCGMSHFEVSEVTHTDLPELLRLARGKS